MRLVTLVVAFVLCSFPGLAPAQVRFSVPSVEVRIGPPPPRIEARPPSPGPEHIWIPGYWSWRGNQHFWIGGRWSRPPQHGMTWEGANWEQHGARYRFREGHWRVSEAPDPHYVYEPEPYVERPPVEIAPPPPIREVRRGAPFRGAVWIPGYWHYNGAHHVWVGGRWSAPAHGHRWEPARWEHRKEGGWVMHDGRWH